MNELIIIVLSTGESLTTSTGPAMPCSAHTPASPMSELKKLVVETFAIGIRTLSGRKLTVGLRYCAHINK